MLHARPRRRLRAAWIAVAILALPAAAMEVRDGRLYDLSSSHAALADDAPAELERLSGFLGDWDLELESHRGEEVTKAAGRARVTPMNRGHAFLERTRVDDFDGAGHAMATLAFIDVDPQGVWTVAEGNSWNESISLSSGRWDGEGEGAALVVHDAIRPGGGPLLLLTRRSYRRLDADHYEMRLETSSDLGATWSPALRRDYRRHRPQGGEADFFPTRQDDGVAAPDRAPEAARFDFLIGQFDARHWLATPDGQERRWQSNATAVHVLDGHAILEFDHFDGNEDGSRPATATSILRIYNRATRQWESLFLPDRSHRPLHFGGVREGDRIVLHLFDAQTGPGSVFEWIFFDVRQDAYRWKGLASGDRGATYRPQWTIDFVRKGSSRAAVVQGEASTIETSSADGTRIFGDLYRAAAPAATTVVLFHQAGGDARGEYGEIARRLQAAGYEVIAWDVRGGGDRFGSPNRAVAAHTEPFAGYCAAYPDLEAALAWSYEHGSGGPLVVVGSSYSAALAIRLAAEHGRRIAGVAAFSPAPAAMEGCAVDRWLPDVEPAKLLAFRPESELEHDLVRQQAELFAKRGVDLVVSAGGAHGASMLDPSRSAGDVEATWKRLEAFLASR